MQNWSDYLCFMEGGDFHSLTTAMEVFHMSMLPASVSLLAWMMDEMILTHARSTPKPEQTGRAAQTAVVQMGWSPHMHRHVHTRVRSFDSFPSVGVHNLLCRSTPNETPQWVWLDLIRVDSIEAGVDGGKYSSEVYVRASVCLCFMCAVLCILQFFTLVFQCVH